MHTSPKIILAALVTGAALCAAPSIAGAASTCTYGNGGPGGFTKTATIRDGSGDLKLRIARQNQFIGFTDGGLGLSFCSGPEGFATIKNTDFIHVIGTPGDRFDGYIVDLSTGAFEPGLTLENDGVSEIEVLIDTAGKSTDFQVLGTTGPDTMRVEAGGGVMLGADGDNDIRFRAANSVSISGLGGNDFLSGRGGSNASHPSSDKQVFLFGGIGSDTLVDRVGAGDVLRGGAQDDTLFSVDGNPLDQVAGDEGFDTGTVEANDSFGTDIERLTKQVGRLHLTPENSKVKAGQPARLKLSWTHPKAWKQLRRIELRVKQAGDTVATAVVDPRTAAHHGKTVTADLAVQLDRKLAGQDLRLEVQATDRDGNTQVEPFAGQLRLVK